ncbi:protein kinase [Candidatus Bathycorpusculum sp.]|uniref:protein kinase domain-containing protein n=1 Tax=Candidatus Bathycorpusculum sp. TaxID=2994959 RepID=UPI00282C202C|nr:HD domain-containing protein [Candidatus Termitimicrobium sp.]
MENRSQKLDSKVENWLAIIKDFYEKDRKIGDYKKEEPFLKIFLARLEEEEKDGRLSFYKLEEPIAKGGSGIVFRASHNHIAHQQLAIKFSRPIFDPEIRSGLEAEIEVIPLLDHFNIIKMVDAGKLEVNSGQSITPPLYYIVEPYILNAKGLLSYIDKLSVIDGEINNDLLDAVLLKFTDIVQQWVYALAHIHNAGFIYLDVKPENVVVDNKGHLLVIDFGTAIKADETDPTPTPVSFSSAYAHPKLQKLVEKTSTGRLRPAIKKMDIKFEFDYYALGKSILELLQKISANHPHDFPQRPLFKSLYFLATRLLDGQNIKPIKAIDARDKFDELPEVFENLEIDDYATIKYMNLDDVVKDLDKELGRWALENGVPELQTFPASTIRVVPNLNTAMTDRLVSLIEHPLIGRLKVVSQLGLVTLIYPTADHSRYDHTLGAYTYTRYYVTALFHDSQNCIFRNLINEQDVKAVLLAAIFHDLGQYPLAHDLQEVHRKIFNHSKISASLLYDPMPDKKGRTLKDIIENEVTGWGVKIDQVKKILEAQSSHSLLNSNQSVQDFKADMLSAIIDGPIDADKADYIIRDSINTRVPYGEQLDIDRLLSVLTTVRIPPQQSKVNKVTIGVYEKGVASASAFSLARYLLHASVYWHHTSRILKAMLQYATVILLPKEVFETYPDEGKIDEIYEKLVNFIKKETIPPNDFLPKVSSYKTKEANSKVDLNAIPSDDAMADISRPDKEPVVNWYPGLCRSDWQMLNWLKRLSSTEDSKLGIALIDLILKRDLYKRVYTIQNESAGTSDNSKLIDKLQDLKWPEKLKLSQAVQQAIQEKFNKQKSTTETKLYPSSDEVQKILNENLAVLVDIPNYKKLTYDRPLIYVPELQSKTYYKEVPAAPSHNLTNALNYLMKSTAPIRVLCHPELRQWIGYFITPDEMRSIITNAIE